MSFKNRFPTLRNAAWVKLVLWDQEYHCRRLRAKAK
jgi:hypothetical protein